MTGDEDSGVEAIGGDVVRCFLETGIVPSLVQLKVLMERTTYACIISSLLPFWEVPLYTTFAMASDVVRCFLETGIVPSLLQLKVLMERTTYACIISSLLPLWEVP